METKDKKDVVNYIIETHDDNSGVPMDDCWDEIDCKGTLEEARAEYEKKLTTYDTLRIVRETRTVIAQSCKVQKLTSELEQSLNEVSKHIHDYLVTFFEDLGYQEDPERQYYVCDIPIMNGEVVTELSLSNDGQTIQVSLYSRDTPLKLNWLSIEDQLIIIKALELYE